MVESRALGCPCGCQENMRIFPMNFMLLFGFTITEEVLVGVICSKYTLVSVLPAVLATGIIVLCLTLYAVTTRTDITGMGGYLLAAAVVLMIFGIFCMFRPFPSMKTMYCCLGILVLSFYQL